MDVALPNLPEAGLRAFTEALSSLVGRDSDTPAGADMTARQLTLMMVVYCETDRESGAEQHTVRGLATRLGLSKPAVSRAIDVLEERALVARKNDPADRRSVLLARTKRGQVIVERLRHIMAGVITAACAKPKA